MKEKKSSENNDRRVYKKPELTNYGSLSSITQASSAGSVPDGGSQPNMNVTNMA